MKKFLSAFLIFVFVCIGVFTVPFSQQTAQAADWYNASWLYRVLLTVDADEVDADLTDFPVYVDLSDLPAGFHTNVKSDGSDIRVTESDGTTEVPREVVFYDSGTDTGELHFKGDLSNTVDTEFYIYYGNASASDYATSDTYGAENVWDANYKGVYHLKDGSTLTLTDSTATQNGTNSNATPSTGKIDGAANVVGTQYIDLGQTGAHYNPITVTAWIKPSSTGSTQQQIVSKGYDGTNTEWQLVTDPGSTVSFNSFTNPNTNGVTSASTVSNGTWYYVGGVYDTTTWRVYFNGVADGSAVDTAPTNTNQKIAIGGVFSSGSIVQNWRGDIDEVRISNVVRSPEWIAAEYSNQNTPNTFYLVGSEEQDVAAPTVTTSAVSAITETTATGNGNVTDDGGSTITQRGVVWSTSTDPTTSDSMATTTGTTGAFSAPITGLSANTTYYVRAFATNAVGTSYGSNQSFTTDAASTFPGGFASWSYRVLLTIDADEVDADLTNFPVYVDLSDLPAGFHSHVKSDGSDIRVTTSDGTTEVPREVVFYDSGTDTGELHFKAPSLSNATDTEFYIYYGNAGASDYATNDTYGAENVWTNGYEAVWHMGEQAAVDSTGNGNNGTATGSPTVTNGAVGESLDFNGSTDYITVANSTSLLQPSVSNRITVSAWINVASHNSAYREIVRKGTSGDAWFLLLNTTNKIAFSTAGNAPEYGAGAAYTADSAWHRVAGTFDGTTIRVYQDGVQVASVAGGAVSDNTDPLIIGAHASSIQLFDGGIDEARVSSVTRSVEWIAAEYSNQNAPNTFYLVGSEEEPSGGEVPARVLRLKGGLRLRGGMNLF